MSIATELQRIQTAKANLKTQIEAKGVEVSSAATIDAYPTYVQSIQTGGGSADNSKLLSVIDGTCSALTASDLSGLTSVRKEGLAYSSYVSVELPDSVTSIGEGAFQNCSTLTSVNIPSGVTSIERSTFQNCSSLTGITIPSGVTSIGIYAFSSCSTLTSIIIPVSVTSIDASAFYYCSALASVTVLNPVPPTISFSVFQNTNNCPIYVPDSSVETYKAATRWSDYADRIQPISEKPGDVPE